MRFFLLRKQTLTILAVSWIALLLLLGSYRRTKGNEMVKLRGEEATVAKTESAAAAATRQHTAVKTTTTSEAAEAVVEVEDREGRCEWDKLLMPSCPPQVQTNVPQRNFTRLPESFLKNWLPPAPLPACPRLHPWRVWRDIAAWNRTRDPSIATTMLFVVKSAARNFVRRRTLRATWASVEQVRGTRFVTVFVLGRPTYEPQQEHIEREASTEGDLLQCDMRDNYRGLPDKVLAAFGWLSGQRPPIDYVTVTDDDCMMRLERVQHAFHPLVTSRGDDVIRCGFDYHRDARPIRDRKSKWYISRRVYPSPWYPTFCHGGMWTVTMSMVEKLWCAAQTTDRGGFYLEDVYITGILRTKVSARCGGDGDADDDDVTSIANMERAGMVRHLSARTDLYAIFARYWRLANSTLPWNETADAVRLRAPPSGP